MQGSMKTFLDNQGNPVFPITLAESVFVDKKTNLSQKLDELNQGKGSYLINIDRFGIKKGLPTKPYFDADYRQANANMIGINNAMEWASLQGYTGVTLPRGSYSMCYGNTLIKPPSYMTLNLNGSTLKVIYESDRKSPYDTRGTTDYYNFVGMAIKFEDVKSSHIINGTILGDAYERIFSDPNELRVEGTYGVCFAKGANGCSISHCKVSGFMGDNITYDSSSSNVATPSGQQLGDIDGSGNFITGSTNTVITGLLSIPIRKDGSAYSSWSLGGVGYKRLTSLNNKEFDIFYYKNGVYMGALKNYRVQELVPIPIGATHFRLKYYNETDATKAMDVNAYFGGIPRFCITEYCEITDGHRGGISAGGSYCIIKNNLFWHNGKYENTFLDGVPAFYDTTRYQINQEDSYGDNTIIRDNVFASGFHGILIRGFSAFIENNVFHNLSGTGIVIYDLQFSSIKGNYLHRATMQFFGAGSQKNAFSVISGNAFIGGGVSDFSNNTYDAEITGNYFLDTIPSVNDNANFHDNVIKLVTASGLFFKFGSRTKNNRFYANPNDATKPNVYVMNDSGFVVPPNEFINLKVTANGSSGAVVYDGCMFNACTIANQNPFNHVTVKNSKLIDTLLSIVNINGAKNALNYIITNSEIISNTLTSIFQYNSNVDGGAAKTALDGCKFTINNNTLANLFTNIYTNSSFNSDIRNCSFTYTGSPTLVMNVFSSDGRVNNSVMMDNTLNNIAFNPMSGSKYKLYDPLVKGISEPTSGYFYLGQIYRHASPIQTGYIGWVCVTEGIANNSSWAASTQYNIGDKINANGYIYEAQATGQSGPAIPSFSSTFGSLTPDNGTSWKLIGIKAAFRTYGVIS